MTAAKIPNADLCMAFMSSAGDQFAELKVMRIQAEEEQWLQMAPAFRQACAPGVRNRTVELISQDFVKRVERLVAQYGDSAEASKKLGELIAG